MSELALGTSPMAALAQLGNHGKAMTQAVEASSCKSTGSFTMHQP